MEYREYIKNQINDADRKYREAMANDDFEIACIYGKFAADLEKILLQSST